jgi:protein-S-isoprenylcysteine O-methyltransferase Ste14
MERGYFVDGAATPPLARRGVVVAPFDSGFPVQFPLVSFAVLRIVVVGFVGFVFFRHLHGANKTFSVVRGERPAPQIFLFPLAIAVILYQAVRAPLHSGLVIPGVLGFAGSLALFERTRLAVRGRFFSYAFSEDQPRFFMKSGPYAYVRNPFYSSYLLSYLSAAVMLPGLATLLVLGIMTWFLTAAALQEEGKFAASPFAADYERYKLRTGRFIPKLRFPSSDFGFGI